MIYAVNKRTKAHEVMDPNALYNTAVWEEVRADPDGWIPHNGNDQPLPDGVLCEVRSYRGQIAGPTLSDAEIWTNKGRIFDIAAYRPILDAKVSHPGTMSGPDKCRSDGGEWPAWDGVGMPRAGALACTSGGECEVIATDAARGQVCVRWNDGELGVVPIGAVKPRPIRSEEDRAIEELEYTLCQKIECLRGTDMKPLALHLYRAGYRKTGGEG